MTYLWEDDLIGMLLTYPQRIGDFDIAEADFAWPMNQAMFRWLRDTRQTEIAVIEFVGNKTIAAWAKRLADNNIRVEVEFDKVIRNLKRERRIRDYAQAVQRIVTKTRDRRGLYGRAAA